MQPWKQNQRKIFTNYDYEDMKWKSSPVTEAETQFCPKGKYNFGRKWEDILFSVSEIRIFTKNKNSCASSPLICWYIHASGPSAYCNRDILMSRC